MKIFTAPLSTLLRSAITLLCCLTLIQSVQSQVLDSKGTDFWLTFPGNFEVTATPSLFISGEANTTGTVSIPGLGVSIPYSVTVGAITTVTLPVGVFLNTSSSVQSNGIHVVAAREVTIYGLNRLTATTDAYLSLPTDVLGTEYINLGYANVDIVNATQFGIVATQNNTTVTITPTVTTDGHAAGIAYNVMMNQGQTYLLRNTASYPADLSGSIIKSDKPIAVFGGHQCANIPRGFVACDHIVEELPPTSAWGKNFITVPLKTRTRGDTFRFLASANGTAVSVNGTVVATLNRGQFFETILTTASQVTSTQPILVAQYSNSSSYDGVTSDPFMMLIPPFEQFLGNYTITTPASGFAQNFVNVVAPSAAVGAIRLDGTVIPAAQFSPIGSSGFSGAQLNIGLGAHTLNGTSLAFGVFVYGFDSFDSYGYPGGESFSAIDSVSSVVISPKTGSGSTGAQTCFTALVRNQFNNPMNSIRVDFNIRGANAAQSGFAFTNTSGIAQFCYAGANAGSDSIIASVGVIRDAAVFTWSANCKLTTSVTIDSMATGSQSNGVATITASNGTPPYKFSVDGSPPTSTGVFNHLSAGTHSYTVTDGTGCTVTGTFVITQKPDGTTVYACPKDTTFIADPATCKAKVTWNAPNAMFPDTISVMHGIGLPVARMNYKGTNDGHGYYESNDQYSWSNARDAAAGAGAHLVSITSAAENNFIGTSIMERFNYAWIGLRNTGTVGNFAWVTGEPLTFTNWIPGEPNNLYNDSKNTTVFEPYVHINGYDSLSRWNDIGGNINARFIAEYDKPVYTYRKLGDQSSGDSLKAGVYNICYERYNSVTKMFDTCCFRITVVCNSITSNCPKDTVFTANPVTCKAKVTWTVPTAVFPDTVSIAKGVNLAASSLIYKGTFAGHGYYESNDLYNWSNAIAASRGAGAHLISITSEAENNFVNASFNERFSYAWIGLRNTGTVGSFVWVTGEPLTFTNWIPGEPNNLYNTAANTTVFEPFVHINGFDPLSRWNDNNGSVNARFLAEYDSAVITYRQISGPSNGDSLKQGVYTICYEKLNRIMNTRDTCCFNITVVCNSMVNDAEAVNRYNGPVHEAGRHIFDAVAFPNPSTTSFSVRINSNNLTDNITAQVVDVTGRIVETRNSITPGGTLKFGSSYLPGVYLTRITQGSKTIIMKMVKQ